MARIDEELAALAALPCSELGEEWRRTYRSDSPRLPPELLRRGIAHRLKERARGKLPPQIANVLA